MYLLASKDADQTTDEASSLAIHDCLSNESPRRLGVGPNLPGACLLRRARSASRAVGDAVRRAFPPLSPGTGWTLLRNGGHPEVLSKWYEPVAQY